MRDAVPPSLIGWAHTYKMISRAWTRWLTFRRQHIHLVFSEYFFFDRDAIDSWQSSSLVLVITCGEPVQLTTDAHVRDAGPRWVKGFVIEYIDLDYRYVDMSEISSVSTHGVIGLSLSTKAACIRGWTVLVIIALDNAYLPVRCQAITYTYNNFFSSTPGRRDLKQRYPEKTIYIDEIALKVIIVCNFVAILFTGRCVK